MRIRFFSVPKVFFLSLLMFVLLLPTDYSVDAKEKRDSYRINTPLMDFAVEAVKVEISPKIDGILTDSCWSITSPIADFTQWRPAQEISPTESTICYLAYDEEFLYFGAKCFDSDPQKVTANMSRRDDIFGDDWILLLIDTYSDQRSAYEFVTNPYGIQGDLIITGNDEDKSWDGVWYSDGTKTDFG